MCNNTYPPLVPDEKYKTANCNPLGKWEPNPNVVCKITSNPGCGSVYVVLLNECSLPNSMFCTGNHHARFNKTILMIIAAALLAAIITAIVCCIGSACSYCFIKRKNSKMSSAHFESAIAPIYEDVLPNPLYHHTEKDADPQTKENMAYGPCTLTCMTV